MARILKNVLHEWCWRVLCCHDDKDPDHRASHGRNHIVQDARGTTRTCRGAKEKQKREKLGGPLMEPHPQSAAARVKTDCDHRSTCTRPGETKRPTFEMLKRIVGVLFELRTVSCWPTTYIPHIHIEIVGATNDLPAVLAESNA